MKHGGVDVQVDMEKALQFYQDMLKIRLFELKAIELQKQGLIFGNLHTYVGQEAIAVGVMHTLGPEDVLTSTHRCDGHFIARGSDCGKMLAEMMGKNTGYCKGKGGKMHLVNMDKGVLGANGIVGAGIPIAAGAALRFKMNGEQRVAVSFFGDGAVNHGYFHEALNLASVWKLPVLFVCENNQYAISTKVSESLAAEHVADRALGYNIPSSLVDGNDVFAVYEAASEAISTIREKEGPILLECVTFRARGHHEGDAQKYRTAKEMDEIKKNDPINSIKKALTDVFQVADEEIENINRQVEDHIATAVDFAINSPLPEESDVFADVFVEGGVVR